MLAIIMTCPSNWQTAKIFLKGSSRILVVSVQNGGFFEASTPASNGSPKSSLGGATFVETARTIDALLARYRPEYPFPSCVPAELESVFPGTYESTTFQRLLPNHWTHERMPAKIHHSGQMPLKSEKSP